MTTASREPLLGLGAGLLVLWIFAGTLVNLGVNLIRTRPLPVGGEQIGRS